MSGRLPAAFDHPEQGFVDALVFHKPLGVSDLAGYFRSATGGARSAVEEGAEDFVEEEGVQEEAERIRAARASSRLPAAVALPPPPPPPPVLDPEGYDSNERGPGHALHRFAYYLDSLFAATPPSGPPPQALPVLSVEGGTPRVAPRG